MRLNTNIVYNLLFNNEDRSTLQGLGLLPFFGGEKMKISKINNGNINDVFILEFDYNKYIIRMSQFNNDFECKILKLLDEYNIDCKRLLSNFILGY